MVFIIAFLIINGLAYTQMRQHKTEEQMKASYTAEATVRRIESQLDKYLSKSDLLKNIIESGSSIEGEQYNLLSEYMKDNSGVIEAIELARDGVVSQVYPLEGNEEVIGLDMFKNPERKYSAYLAKKSGQYTIAGPFKLVQGGVGALLFDPIYLAGSDGEKNFWGFSILVINWEKFIQCLELDKLEDTAYQYKIWKKNPQTGEPVYIAESPDALPGDFLEIACDVPNDTWYFDIAPTAGWYSRYQLLIETFICIILAILVSLACWQFEMRRYKESVYSEEIKKTAEEAKAANMAKTSFLSRMSHDIRTPLNGIIGLLKIDEQHPDDQKLIQNNRKKMQVAADHLLALINDVLQMSKLENGQVILSHEVIDLNELSVDILTIMEQRAAETGITLEYDRVSDKVKYPYVYGSPLHLRQMFLNVYGNCIKYNNAGGKVTTQFEYLGNCHGIVKYRWIISDTGIGMSQEFLEHIFEPFAQEHSDARSIYNGTGLGMAIVKSLVDKMNGTIEVSSIAGKGSTFVITLPFEIAEKEKKKESVSNGKPDIQGVHLLLVEDNDLNAEIAQVLLEDAGAQVFTVKNGQQAVECFSRNPQGTFDAILMDVMMPVMDGIAATKAIRALDREDASEIPIIAMTANAFDEDGQRCIAAGMNAHLTKPLQIEKVIATIAKYCKR